MDGVVYLESVVDEDHHLILELRTIPELYTCLQPQFDGVDDPNLRTYVHVWT